MSASHSFLAMRAGLIERGLICGETLQLTDAGNAWTIATIAALKGAPPPEGLQPEEPRVRWTPLRERWAARRKEAAGA